MGFILSFVWVFLVPQLRIGNVPRRFFLSTRRAGAERQKFRLKNMKKVLLSALALLSTAGSGFAQNLPSYVPANGLVGWWPFNGNANDESGNNNNGTVNGATLTTDRFGNAWKAYGFDGVNDAISVNSLFDSSTKSINVWVKPNLIDVTPRCIVNIDGPQVQNGANVIRVEKINGIDKIGLTGATSVSGSAFIEQDPLINQWQMVTMVKNPVSTALYFNGTLVGTVGSGTYRSNDGLNKMILGADRNMLDYWFNGSLDDIAIYNRALTQQEITALYQGGITTANCLDLPSNLQQGLVGYWPFCGNANDESGNGNNGTVNGATLTADRFGNAGSAYQFDGASNYINMGNNPQLSFTESFSISCWMNPDTVPSVFTQTGGFNSMAIIDKAVQNAAGGYRLEYSADTSIRTKGFGPLDQISNSNIHPKKWTHIVYTLNASEQTSYIFIDGVLDKISTGVNPPIVSSTNLWVGAASGTNGFPNQFWFDGILDDIAIWNRALSPQEITQLYNQGICKTSITVTDTLLIHTGITGYNPVAYQNTLKVWPNPGNQNITLDAGNLASMQGWKIKISNSLGQEVYPATVISQQQQILDLSNWGGNGLYLLHLINPQGHITEVKKIILAP